MAELDAQSSKCSERGVLDKGFDGHKKIQGRKRQLLVDTGGLLLAAHVGPAHENVVLPKSWTVYGGYLSQRHEPQTYPSSTATFKAEVALAALTERHPLAELATRYQLSVEQISRWKTQLRQQAAQVFTEPGAPVAAGPDVEPLYAAIGRLQMENALLKKTLGPCA